MPGDELTSYWLDLDSGTKVRPEDERADVAKGSQDCCGWAVENGAAHFVTGLPPDDFHRMEFPCHEDMGWNADVLEHTRPNTSVICVMTASGSLFAYYAEFECCGDNILHWRTEGDRVPM